MQEMFTKKDWKLFRAKLPGWQEAYMDKLNCEYIALLSEKNAPSEKFWRLDERIKMDKKSPGVKLQMTRTNLIYNIISLINDGVIGVDDLKDFSDNLKEAMRAFTERQFWDVSDEE